ncbi:transcriptional repressor NrdR [Gordonia aichiensis NBRC 108223]|uniref:Transcriptional repressor NrdR n=2 Tax=Gordonia aichiensis TaxID=36820 RepID=L7KJR0_9ACTN|nr:transcriptional repressor NrdR [Gordonia aichiensis NBRC 108223]
MSQGPVGNRHGHRCGLESPGRLTIRTTETVGAAASRDLHEDYMRCPFCKNEDTKVVDSRVADEGQAIRRRRACSECGRRFSTVESAVLSVVKRNGVTEPFSREKVMRGVRRACQGRQVNEDDLAQLAQQVEDAVRSSGSAEIPSNEVGLAILGPLRDLDEVAYLRFASVYRSFDSVEDFQREIDDLQGNLTGSRDGSGDLDDSSVRDDAADSEASTTHAALSPESVKSS